MGLAYGFAAGPLLELRRHVGHAANTVLVEIV